MKKKTSDKKGISNPPRRTNIAVNINLCCGAIRFNHKKIIKMIRKVAYQFGVKKAQINFVVLGDAEIARLNRRFLGRSNSTDVISFNLSDRTDDDLKVFDIAVNAQMAQREAKKRRNKPQSELALYFLHGLLHNLGFDDSTIRKAAKMHRTEDKILKEFGYGIVYKSDPQ